MTATTVLDPTIPDIGLASKAVLVDLSISRWDGWKFDKKISAEVDASHGATNAGRYNKRTMETPLLQQFGIIEGRARADHQTRTLPWTDKGPRILPIELYFEYMQALDKLRAEWDATLNIFLPQYPSLRDAERVRLNGMWRVEDYPREDRLREKFSFTVQVTPVPDARDFRVSITDTELRRIQTSVSVQQLSAVVSGTKELLTRMRDGAADMAKRLRNTKLNSAGEEVGNFKSSVVSNLTDLLPLVRKLNINDDEDVTRLADEIGRDLASLSVDELKASAPLRTTAMQRAQEIASKLQSYLGDQS